MLDKDFSGPSIDPILLTPLLATMDMSFTDQCMVFVEHFSNETFGHKTEKRHGNFDGSFAQKELEGRCTWFAETS